MSAQKRFTDEEARERKNARQREYAKRTGYASNKKYNAKTNYSRDYIRQSYKQYNVHFKKDNDKKLIDFIEYNKEQGFSATETLRKVFQDVKND